MIHPFPMSSSILKFSGLKPNCGFNMLIFRRENTGGTGEVEQRQNLNTKNEKGKGRGRKGKREQRRRGGTRVGRVYLVSFSFNT
jgi:hypothetical protein